MTVLLLAWLASELAAPSQIQASCGHYVTIGNPQVTGEDAEANAPAMAQGQHHFPKQPCSGPDCKANKIRPVPIIPTNGNNRDRSDCLIAFSPVTQGETWSIIHGDDCSQSLVLSSSIFRPPRSC